MEQNYENRNQESAETAAAAFTSASKSKAKVGAIVTFGLGLILLVVLYQLGVGSRPQSDLATVKERYGYDVTRLKNAANIMLALQDYNFVNYDFPEKLDNLKPVYLGNDANLTDPETSAPYYYSRISDISFTLCIYVEMGGTVGVNIKDCPAKPLQLE